MKRFYFAAIALLLALALAACASSNDKTDSTKQEEPAAAAETTASAESAAVTETAAAETEPDAAEADTQTEAQPAVKTLELSNDVDMTVTLEYPDSFTYDEDYYESMMSTRMVKKCGKLTGDDFSVCMAYVQSSYTGTFDEWMNQFKKGIYEEPVKDGHKTIIFQNYVKEGLFFAVPYNTEEKTMFLMSFMLPGEGHTSEDYQTLYESEAVQNILASIKVDSTAVEAETIANEYYEITEAGGWTISERPNGGNLIAKFQKPQLDPAAFVQIHFTLSDAERSRGYIMEGFPDGVEGEITIGDNTYWMLTNGEGGFIFLHKQCSSGTNGVEITIGNCTVEDAMALLETVVVK